MICPLCRNDSSTLYDQDNVRSYQRCDFCQLVFVPRDAIISPEEEKKRYDFHENSTTDAGYRDYLNTIVENILPYVADMKEGLDFGSGRSNLLQTLLEERGLTVDSYDLYYHPNETIWNKQYDFIVLSEVIEHVKDPREVMERLRLLLRPQGKIFVKTKPYPAEVQKFKNWFYKRDITHIQFFNQNAFEALAEVLKFCIPVMIGEDLFLFKE